MWRRRKDWGSLLGRDIMGRNEVGMLLDEHQGRW
jgi:hypothetical protein